MTSRDVYARESALAKELAQAAGAVLREGVTRYRSADADYKSSAVDPVTEYDRRCEALIVGALRDAFPQDRVQGEEGGDYHAGDGAGNGRRWYVDPLDGTVNFAHGIPHFSVSIALLEHGIPRVGVVFNPMLNELFCAVRGAGATLNEAPIRVSPVKTLLHAVLGTGFPYDRQTSPVNNFDNFVRIKKQVQAVRRMGSAALDLCYVAAGRYDGYWELKIKPHDIAAGMLIVTEAGGRCTNFAGRPGAAAQFAGECVATNGHLHDALVAQLAAKV
jgi:myo-inositol-1(or 4)-monophosphatase